MPLRAVLIDMGGVLLEFGNAEGLPMGRYDFRGREALLALLRERGGVRARTAAAARAEQRFSQDELEEVLFAPWKREHARRHELGREADWHPHLARLRRRTRRRFSDRRLLGTWFAPFAETVAPLPGAVEALAAVEATGLPLALVSNIPCPLRSTSRCSRATACSRRSGCGSSATRRARASLRRRCCSPR